MQAPAPGARSCRDELLEERKEAHASVAPNWVPALEGRASPSGDFCEAHTPQLRVKEGRVAIGTEFKREGG